MRALEELCEDVKRFAHANPDARKAVVTDGAAYGAGMDAMIAMTKLRALSDYARKEHRILLLICNGPDVAICAPEAARVGASALGEDA